MPQLAEFAEIAKAISRAMAGFIFALFNYYSFIEGIDLLSPGTLSYTGNDL
ncbi:MAG: hypothetical protein AB7S54_07795 [Bacteroidales bacterium]